MPPENVVAVQVDGQTVRVSWSAIPSDRQPNVASDITFYEVEYYSVGGAVQTATNVQTGTSTGLSINLSYQRNNAMVLAARVRGVTQLRREPDSFGPSPWSEVAFSGAVPRKCANNRCTCCVVLYVKAALCCLQCLVVGILMYIQNDCIVLCVWVS